MTALESLTHPWIDKISDKLIANLTSSHGDNIATKNFTNRVLSSIYNYKKEDTNEKEMVKRSCLSIIASKLITAK